MIDKRKKTLTMLLRLRRRRELLARRDFAAADGKAARIRGRLGRLKARLGGGGQSIHTGQADGMGYRLAVREIRRELVRGSTDLAGAQEALGPPSSALRGAFRLRKALEVLQQRRCAARAEDHRRRLQRELDETHGIYRAQQAPPYESAMPARGAESG
ncbi:MAG: hypothetical protein J7M14_00755 [Planctomycetes bacterium]|nr:hypothetical protein [Planctomycetota bacterium]